MRGSIAFDSVMGQGTAAYLTLPFGTHDKAATADVGGATLRDRQNGKLRVLLVEDGEVSRLSARLQLERLGNEVMTASNGAEALAALRSGPFDCVLMDIQMDVMNGIEAAREIRSGASGVLDAQVPIIAMTAYSMQGDKDNFLAAGMNDYIAKPILFDALAAVMVRTLASGRAGKSG